MSVDVQIQKLNDEMLMMHQRMLEAERKLDEANHKIESLMADNYKVGLLMAGNPLGLEDSTGGVPGLP